jgi:hypothetical protein
MNRDGLHRSAAAACGLLAATALLTGCGSATRTTGSAPRQAGTSVTPAQAAAVVQTYEQKNNAVNATADSAGLATIETSPLRSADQALMTISTTLKQKASVITDTNTQAVIPAQSGHPHWFLSISRRVIGGVPASQPTYDIYVQDGSSSPFLAAYALTPIDQEDIGPFALNKAGAATSVTSTAGLLMAPSDLGRAITDHYVRGLRTKDAFGYSAALDDSLGTGFNEGVKVLKSRGIALTRAVASVDPQSYALRTADGGAVAFTAVTVTDRLVATTPKAMASLRAGSNDAALLGKPKGATAKSFTINRLEMFMTYIPTKAAGTKVKVLAYSETAVSVK